MTRTALLLISIAILATIVPCSGGLSPCNVAVVVNKLSTESEAVGHYYCLKTGVPLSNLIEVKTLISEQIEEDDFHVLAQQIRTKLVTQLGVDPDDPANDPIQALVLCYGVPFIIHNDVQDQRTSVDSWLTLLFNRDPDLGPGDTADTLYNPYCRPYDDVNFATFRASAASTVPDTTHRMRSPAFRSIWSA